MITKLTTEQESRMAEFRDRWIALGLSMEPANRPEAEDGIRLAYAAAGLPVPRIVWCGSPMSQGITRAVAMDLNANQIGASVWDSVWDSVWVSVRDSVGASVGASVRDSVWDSVWVSVWASVRDSVGDSVWVSVRDSVGASVRDSVWDSVWVSVRASVGASVGDSVGASGYGHHDAGWLSFYDYFREVCGLKNETEKLAGILKISKNAGWWLPHRSICWVSERHNILNRDERGRLHCDNGPALGYPDGWSIYAIHGVRVPEQVVISPQTLTAAEILDEKNAEVRRVMLDRFGKERLMKEGGAKSIHSDDFGTLWRLELNGDEPLVVVEVVNSTPEPDGSFKNYFLRVPPEMQRTRQAVAWTFGKREEHYAPEMQT